MLKTARDGGYIKISERLWLPRMRTDRPVGVCAISESTMCSFLNARRAIIQMQIFDRWGTKIFQTEDPETGWDGYNRSGELMSAGVYVYKIEVTLSNGTKDAA